MRDLFVDAPELGRKALENVLRELASDVVGEIAPHLLSLVQRVERRQRECARRINLQHFAVDADRLLGLTQHLVVDLRHLAQHQLALARVGEVLGLAAHAVQVAVARSWALTQAMPMPWFLGSGLAP